MAHYTPQALTSVLGPTQGGEQGLGACTVIECYAVLFCAVVCSGNMVRRSMNRPPQEADCRSYSKSAAATAPAGAYCRDARCWYHGHVRTCGGVYEKVRRDARV
jgi:hypothetical protein